MTTTLPSELIFHVISFLHGDKATLSTCSLSCSTLATISKPLLFHTLRADLISEAAARFEGISEPGSAMLQLIKRIDVAIPIFAPTLDQRTVTAVSRIMTRRQLQDTPPKLNITARFIHSSPSQFEQLILPRLDPVVPWVTSLEFDQVGHPGPEHLEFWPIVLAFPNLTSLTLGWVNVGRAQGNTPSHRVSDISHLTLKRLAFDDSCDICWFLADNPLPLPSLTSLDVRFPAAPDSASIRFGEQYGAMVRSLRFGVVIRSPTMHWGQLDCKL